MNHPIDNPDTCCPTCFGEGEILPESVAQEKADAQALADVRTLDEWAAADKYRTWGMYTEQFEGRPTCSLKWQSISETNKSGPTPDAARHAAAEWVRGQVQAKPPNPILTPLGERLLDETARIMVRGTPDCTCGSIGAKHGLPHAPSCPRASQPSKGAK